MGLNFIIFNHITIEFIWMLTGLARCFNNFVYSIPIPKGFMAYNIAHLEMFIAVVALKV